MERSELIRRLQYRDDLTLPPEEIEAEELSRVIANASESAPGPDGVKYSTLKTLNDQDLHCITDQLNKSLAEQKIPKEWLESHLAPVPKPDKDRTGIKGYRIVTMQNTTGKMLKKVI